MPERKPAVTRETVQPKSRETLARKLKAAAIKDERLLEEIRQGLADEKRGGRIRVRELDQRRVKHGGV